MNTVKILHNILIVYLMSKNRVTAVLKVQGNLTRNIGVASELKMVYS